MQAASVGEGIKNMAIGSATVGYLITTIILLFVYNLSKNKLVEINDELAKKRAMV